MSLEWKTEKRKVDELIPFSDNPRRLSPKDKTQLIKSFKKFNLVEIPAINTDNKIIAGHQRLKIMKLLGWGNRKIDVRVPNRKLTDKEFKEYLLRSNKNTGEWDTEILNKFDDDLLREIGFSEKDLSRAIKDDTEPEEEFTSEILEENNYLVFIFDNAVDWLAISDYFSLKSVNAKDSKADYKRKGIGRVLNGKKLLKMI